MKISPITSCYISSNSPKKRNSQTTHPLNKSEKYIQVHYPGISFGRINLDYTNFISEILKVYKGSAIKDVLLTSIADERNLVGYGFSSKVYAIPKIPNYLIRIDKRTFNPENLANNSLIPQILDSRIPDFGQDIARSGCGLSISKRVSGKSHSFSDWSKKIIQLEKGNDILTKEDALFFLKQLKELSEFPQQRFNKLAKNIKILNSLTKCEIDFLNPNNLIIDKNTKSLGIVDLWDYYDCKGNFQINGVDSIINLILDPMMHINIFNKLDNNGKTELLNTSKIIIQKCLKAGEITKLNRNKDFSLITYENFDKSHKLNYALPHYTEFLKLYSGLL